MLRPTREPRPISIARTTAGLAAFVFVLALSGCADRSAAAATDAGEAAVLPKTSDGGVEAGLAAAADAGPAIDDTVMPQPSAEELAIRMRHLLEALTQSNPDLAADVLFPRDAYAAARDAADPQKAWEKKVSLPFRRAVERTNKRTKGMEGAKFLSFELGRSMSQVPPKKHEFKKPLWRVKHSKLTFTIDGKPHHIEIAEMTAWRGAWYVTRLR